MGRKSAGPLCSKSCNQQYEAELVTGCTSGIPQGFIVGIMLFNIFIHDLGGGMECSLSKFVGNMTLEGAAVMLGGQDSCLRDLNRLENDLIETREVLQGQMGSGISRLGWKKWVVLAKVQPPVWGKCLFSSFSTCEAVSGVLCSV